MKRWKLGRGTGFRAAPLECGNCCGNCWLVCGNCWPVWCQPSPSTARRQLSGDSGEQRVEHRAHSVEQSGGGDTGG